MVAFAPPASDFEIESFLEQEQSKDLLRFSTAGSVDDGKSTLIGRLLYDSQSVYEDQLKSVVKASVNRSAGAIDFSLLTDGLRAEREQGITIDVAYRYFATARRKFIIADTPGHEQYTRNMATGASTAELAIILIDARNGVLRQSRRHAYIASLLGIPNFVVAVNKMDLVGYDEAVFSAIETEFREFLSRLNRANVYFLPISALAGDNVVHRSHKMRWFEGPSLLEHLEDVPVLQNALSGPFRFPVQRVMRPDQTFRGYAGQIASGSVSPGDNVLVLPSGRQSRIKSIETFDGQLDRAHAPMSVTLTLEDEVDISRGDLISTAQPAATASRQFEATVVWMSEKSLDASHPYLLKHTAQTVKAEVKAVCHRVNIQTLDEEPAGSLEMNGIGVVRIETNRPVFFDLYRRNRGTGCFVLIDPSTNATVGAGMISASLATQPARRPTAEIRTEAGRVTSSERIARYRHLPAIVQLGRRRQLAWLLERRLFDRGCAVSVLEHGDELAARALQDAGMLVLVASDHPADRHLPADDHQAAGEMIRTLEQSGILLPNELLTGGEGI
jgi:sulfate adenylyltransferase large subunit